jgi:hypothetical protein
VIDLLPPAKPVGGPKWSKNAGEGYAGYFSGEFWEVVSTENRGRVIHWRARDGRKARTEATPDHPDYPPDPTPAQLKAEHAARKEEKKKRHPFFRIP